MENESWRLVEYLCLGCGTQGMARIESHPPGPDEPNLIRDKMPCPRCGSPAPAFDFPPAVPPPARVIV